MALDLGFPESPDLVNKKMLLYLSAEMDAVFGHIPPAKKGLSSCTESFCPENHECRSYLIQTSSASLMSWSLDA